MERIIQLQKQNFSIEFKLTPQILVVTMNSNIHQMTRIRPTLDG